LKISGYPRYASLRFSKPHFARVSSSRSDGSPKYKSNAIKLGLAFVPCLDGPLRHSFSEASKAGTPKSPLYLLFYLFDKTENQLVIVGSRQMPPAMRADLILINCYNKGG